MFTVDECDWARLGATGGAGVVTPSARGVFRVHGSVGSAASNSDSWLGTGEEEGFIEVA